MAAPLLDDVLEEFAKRYALTPFTRMYGEILLATLTATRMSYKINEEPPWLQVCAPPSDMKTTWVESLDLVPDVFYLDNATASGMISGYKDPENPEIDFSLVKDLDGKLLVIKDLSTVVARPQEAETLFNLLRGLYDGRASRKFGNEQGVREYKLRFGVVICTVPHQAENTHEQRALGERFLHVEYASDNLMDVALRAADRKANPVDEALKNFVLGFTHGKGDLGMETVEYDPDDFAVPLAKLGLFTALIRGVGIRAMDDVEYVHERPARLVNQLRGLTVGLSYNRNFDLTPVRFSEWQNHLRFVCLSCVPRHTRLVLAMLWLANQENRTLSALSLAGQMHFGRKKVGGVLSELAQIKLPNELGGGRLLRMAANNDKVELREYRLSPAALALMDEIKWFPPGEAEPDKMIKG